MDCSPVLIEEWPRAALRKPPIFQSALKKNSVSSGALTSLGLLTPRNTAQWSPRLDSNILACSCKCDPIYAENFPMRLVLAASLAVMSLVVGSCGGDDRAATKSDSEG